MGDRLLCEVAQGLINSIGAFGKIGRLAGDEFLIFMSKNDTWNPSEFAGLLCNAAARSSVNQGDISISRTVSIGYTVINEILDPEHVVVNANRYSPCGVRLDVNIA